MWRANKKCTAWKDANGNEILDINNQTIPVIAKKTRKIFMLCEQKNLGIGRELSKFKTTFEKKGDALMFGGFEMLGFNIFARGVACIEIGCDLI